MQTASHNWQVLQNSGGQSAVSGEPGAVVAAAADSWTSDVVSAEQQWGGKDNTRAWAEILDSEDPLELDAICWFYLDPSVSPALCILSTFGMAPLCMHVSLRPRHRIAFAGQLEPLAHRTIKQKR